MNNPSKRFGVFLRTWQNGKLIDEALIALTNTFAEAAARSQELTATRVRLNNDDVTASVERVDEHGRPLTGAETPPRNPG